MAKGVCFYIFRSWIYWGDNHMHKFFGKIFTVVNLTIEEANTLSDGSF